MKWCRWFFYILLLTSGFYLNVVTLLHPYHFLDLSDVMHKLLETFIALAAQPHKNHDAIKVKPGFVISQPATILDKTVEKIAYLGSIFLNILNVPILPSPPPPESNVVCSKESLIPERLLWEATLNWGKGISFLKAIVLEIVIISSSFVRDCSLFQGLR